MIPKQASNDTKVNSEGEIIILKRILSRFFSYIFRVSVNITCRHPIRHVGYLLYDELLPV